MILKSLFHGVTIMIESMIVKTEWVSKYGFEESALLWWIVHWIKKNEADEINFHDGKTWTYNSKKAWSELFPFWTEKQIRRLLDNLIERGAIITGCYNKQAFDKTLWYSFSDSFWAYRSAQTGQCDQPKRANVISPNGPTNTIKENHKEVKETKTQKPLWKTDFSEYKKIVEEAKQKIINSPEVCSKRILQFFPSLDIKKSLELSIDRYWGTEAGWKNKKKCRAAEIDMVETLIRNIDKNKVFLPRDTQQDDQQPIVERDVPKYPNPTTLQVSVQEEFPEKYNYDHYPPDDEETVWRWMFDKICRVPKPERPAAVAAVKVELEKRYA
jgi:hypothetical protein